MSAPTEDATAALRIVLPAAGLTPAGTTEVLTLLPADSHEQFLVDIHRSPLALAGFVTMPLADAAAKLHVTQSVAAVIRAAIHPAVTR